MIASADFGATRDAELSAFNERFRQFARRSEACLNRSTFAELDRPNPLLRYALQPWPTFIGSRTMKEVETVTLRVNRLIRSIPTTIFQGSSQRLAQVFGLDASFLDAMLLPPNGIDGAVGRADLVMTRSGFQCIEFNIASSLGGWESKIVSEMLLRVPVIRDFLQCSSVSLRQRDFVRELFAHCLRETMASCLAEDGEVNLGIGSREPIPSGTASLIQRLLGAEYRTVLREHDRSLRGELLLCHYPELTSRKDELLHSGKRVHSLLEWHHHGSDPLAYRCFKAGTVHLYNGPASFLLSDKRCIALLSELGDAGQLAPEDCELVRRHIPWTRRVVAGSVTYHGEEVFLPGFVLSERHRLVLKKANLGGGTDVVLGKFSSDGPWSELLLRSLAEGDWVVQELVESLPYLYQSGPYGCSPHDVIWGPFVFGHDFGGVSLRVQPKTCEGVVNLHRGATVGVVLEVDES